MASDHVYHHAAPPPSPRLPPPPPSPHPSHLHAPQISPRRFAVQPPLLNTTLAPPQPAAPSYLHASTPATASSLSLPFSPSLTPSTYAPSPVAPASPMAMRGAAPAAPSYLHASTPATASSLSLPFSPSLTPSTYAPSPVAPASPMAMRGAAPAAPYNPQQWSRGTPVGGHHVQHNQLSVPSRLHDVTGMEGTDSPFSLAPAPPPYVAESVDVLFPFSSSSSASSPPKHGANLVPSILWSCAFPLVHSSRSNGSRQSTPEDV